jgi:hypothetical protein
MSTMMEISDVGNGGGDDPGVSYHQPGEHRIHIDFSYEEAAVAEGYGILSTVRFVYCLQLFVQSMTIWAVRFTTDNKKGLLIRN